MSAVAGFLGTSVAFVAGLISTAAGLVVLGVLWKAGAFPVLGEVILIIFRGIFINLPGLVFGFFGDLLAFFQS